MAKDKTWFILKDTIPANREDDLLGALVEDFRDPIAGFVPISVQPRLLVPAIAKAVETDDLNARIEIGKINSTALSAQLLEVFTGSHVRGQQTNVVLESSRIRTRKLVNHPKLFAELIAHPSVKAELETFIKTRNKRKLFFVVGIKTCLRSQLNTSKSQIRENTIGAGVPLDAVAGIPGLIPSANLGGSVGFSTASTSGTSSTWEDERIFAIEYRVARRDWFGFGAQTELRNKLDNADGAAFFGSDEENSDIDSETDGEGDEVDNLGLIDARHDWSCFSEDGAQLDATSGYIF